MTAPALQQHYLPPRPTWKPFSASEAASALWQCHTLGCCIKAPFSDLERAQLVKGERPMARQCADCERPMSWSFVPTSSIPDCRFCKQPISDHTTKMVAALDDGTFAWSHTLCFRKVARRRSRTEGYRDCFDHPDCARCGKPWAEHFTFGFETRSCTDDPVDTALYERAPGVVGVEAIE